MLFTSIIERILSSGDCISVCNLKSKINMEPAFTVYRNPAVSAALSHTSLRPNRSESLTIFFLTYASAFALLFVVNREDGFLNQLTLRNLPQEAAYVFVKAVQSVIGLLFIGSIFALIKVLYIHFTVSVPFSKGDQLQLTKNQLRLLGIKPAVEKSEPSKKPPKSMRSSADALVPLHEPIASSIRKSSFSTSYLAHGSRLASTPWSSKRSSHTREIRTDEAFERFLVQVDEEIIESARRLTTPPPTTSVFGIGSSANATATLWTTPLTTYPGSENFTTPPKKGENDPPLPMSMEGAIQVFRHLHIYPQIEQWRDRLRQWFSSVLLNPLLNKIDNSHLQVMHAAAKLGISITVSPVGSDLPTRVSPPIYGTSYTPDEDTLLHQLRANLVHGLEMSARSPLANQQQNAIIQECVDAITEHQRLNALMKGVWVKGLLPQSSIRADYTVQRIRELAEGTCVRNYEYLGNGEIYDKKNNRWTLELPTDSHLLLYLFCVFLEHPKWMLHVDPVSHASGKNPLFLGVMPQKERSPEKYIAVTSSVPSTLHPGASVLVVGKKSQPTFALYWDKKLQFCYQGRTALWDSILLVCHRINVEYKGIVRGVNLGSPAMNILSVFDTQNDFF